MLLAKYKSTVVYCEKANIIFGYCRWSKLCSGQDYSNFPIILRVCQSANLALGLFLFSLSWINGKGTVGKKQLGD